MSTIVVCKKKLFLCIALCTVFASAFFCSCSKNDSVETVGESVSELKHVSSGELEGTWLFKGNSPKAALIDFHLYSNAISCEIIEYEMNGSNYSFKGNYSLLIEYENMKNDSINIPKAMSYIPIVEEGKPLYIYYDENIDRQSYFCQKFQISKTDDGKIRLSNGNNFFIGSRNYDYIGNADSPTVSSDDYVDMGLSVLWAKCNIGATKAEEYGIYAGWGDPTGERTSTNLDDYPCDEFNLPSSICGTEYDIAKTKWQKGWRLPSYIELCQLDYCCIEEETIFNGIKGVKYMGITGKSLFIPYAGIRIGTNVSDVGRGYGIWSGERFPYYSDSGKAKVFNTAGSSGNGASRYIGLSVRAVCNK